MFPEDMAAQLRIARKRAGLTQQEMGRRYGISRRAIVYWEQGEHLPPEWAVRLLLDRMEKDRKEMQEDRES